MKKIIVLVAAAAGLAWAVGKSKAQSSAQTRPSRPTRGPRRPTGSDPGQPGAVAQLVAHLLCKQGVRGSSPLSSTSSPLTQ